MPVSSFSDYLDRRVLMLSASSTSTMNTFSPSIFDVLADSGRNHEAVFSTAKLFVGYTSMRTFSYLPSTPDNSA
jgi:hypothetical protein